jgi:site-specific DNA-methyltransferase (adenine-specific)
MPRRAAASGTITGFAGKQYLRVRGDLLRYDDRFEDYWGFLEPRLAEAWRVLADDGTLYLHLDYREAHYAKVLLDALFGRECFLNEIVWAYDYGAKAKRRWPTKHDTILVYVKDPARYWFDSTARRPRALHGTWPRDAREGRARQAAHRRVVAHHRVADGSARRPDIRPRSPRGSCGASCRRRRARATGCSTSSRARARPARSPPPSAGGSCWSTRTPRRSRSCARAFSGIAGVEFQDGVRAPG